MMALELLGICLGLGTGAHHGVQADEGFVIQTISAS
jgi:hypothetical protein